MIPPLVVFLLVAVFYLNIGDRRLSILALVPAFLGSIWTFGFLALTGTRIDIVTVIVPIFVIVMGSADGLHFVTHFQEAVEETTDKVARVRSTLKHVGIPMILTTISTAAGFLSAAGHRRPADPAVGPVRRRRHHLRRDHLVLHPPGDPVPPRHRTEAPHGDHGHAG